MKRVCVFAGSSSGNRAEYAESARALGRELASRHVGLVYGGGGTGLMGLLAEAVLEAGGEVTGVIPGALADRELAHSGLTELLVVDSMHERKAKMATLADGFVALPGGLGTLEELMEIWTWAQLGIHARPCGILNVEGYYDPLLDFISQMVRESFVKPIHRRIVIVESDARRLVDALEEYEPPRLRKWMDERGM